MALLQFWHSLGVPLQLPPKDQGKQEPWKSGEIRTSNNNMIHQGLSTNLSKEYELEVVSNVETMT